MVLDGFIHQRMGEGRLVRLVVTELSVADNIDNGIVAELLSKLKSEIDSSDYVLGLISVHVKYGNVHDLGHICRKERGSCILGSGGKSDLVVDEDMNSPSGSVSSGLG
jgi:hypothetical protein